MLRTLRQGKSVFNYSPEWYATESVELWLPQMKSAEDLLYHYTDPTIIPFIYNGIRFDNGFQNYKNLSGRCLELGFNSGLTVHRLAEKYQDLKVDGIDFNPALKKIIPWIKSFLPNIDDLWIGSSEDTPKYIDHYDYITSLDYFEHLPEEVYHKTLIECRFILKSDGLMFVYLGKPPNPEHINRRTDEQVKKDFAEIDFSFVEQDGKDGIMVFRNDKNE